jgi:hypothetical protein
LAIKVPFARYREQRKAAIYANLNSSILWFVMKNPPFPVLLALLVPIQLLISIRLFNVQYHRLLNGIRFSVLGYPSEEICWTVKDHVGYGTCVFDPVHLANQLCKGCSCIILPYNTLYRWRTFSCDDEVVI